MKDDTRQELERIEKELLAQERETEELPEELFQDDELLREVLAEPAFEDADEIRDPEEPLVYSNFANDYGRDAQEESAPKEPISKDDKINIGLMIGASALALGIIIVMIYWLTKFL